MNIGTALAHELTEKGVVPDVLIRHGIRGLLAKRLVEIGGDDEQDMADRERRFIASMDQAPIALTPEKANEQHYELPAEFFTACLGERLKYSCGYWGPEVQTLEQAENRALQLTCDHADIQNGQDILELGCGWGSLTLWMAEHYPAARITAVSNSSTQRDFILERARQAGISNINIITADMNDFETGQQFDRVVSVEMFEHMRNYRKLYARVASWLKPEGKFFKHIFVHRNSPYAFEDRDASDWMSRYFFTGGTMPSDNLPLFFQDHMAIDKRWRWDGRHYQMTSNAWLERMDASKEALWPVFEDTYGKDFAPIWWRRWRMFYMACAELFGYDNGQQWWVSHYLFSKRGEA